MDPLDIGQRIGVEVFFEFNRKKPETFFPQLEVSFKFVDDCRVRGIFDQRVVAARLFGDPVSKLPQAPLIDFRYLAAGFFDDRFYFDQ